MLSALAKSEEVRGGSALLLGQMVPCFAHRWFLLSPGSAAGASQSLARCMAPAGRGEAEVCTGIREGVNICKRRDARQLYFFQTVWDKLKCCFFECAFFLFGFYFFIF